MSADTKTWQQLQAALVAACADADKARTKWRKTQDDMEAAYLDVQAAEKAKAAAMDAIAAWK